MCCVFRPDFRCCKHLKAGRTTFFQPFSTFFVDCKPFSMISLLKSTRNVWKWTKKTAVFEWFQSFFAWETKLCQLSGGYRGYPRYPWHCFDQLLGASSTQKLVKIHNNLCMNTIHNGHLHEIISYFYSCCSSYTQWLHNPPLPRSARSFMFFFSLLSCDIYGAYF